MPVSLVTSHILAQQLSDAVKKEDDQYAGHMLPHDVKVNWWNKKQGLTEILQ